MNQYPEPDSHSMDKVKLVLDLSSFATKKDVNTSDLATKKRFHRFEK